MTTQVAAKRLRANEALREALFEEMERDETVVVFGEDVGVYGGLYKVTEGLLSRFGPERVRDTPISEAGILGLAVGMAQIGMRPVVEIMYMDFVGVAMDPIVTHMGTVPYIWDQDLPMVVRIQGGTGGSSPHHAKTLEAWFCHVPDIVIMAPATASDHKALLKAAIRDPRPVIFVESRHIYGESEVVPDDLDVGEIGRAAVRQEGSDVTIITWGRMLYRSLEAAKALEGRYSVEVIDLRTLVPLDVETLRSSVEKTGRCLIVHEAWTRMGYGAEIAARVSEAAFEHLEAPIMRFGAVNRPMPFSPVYLDYAIPTTSAIEARVLDLLAV